MHAGAPQRRLPRLVVGCLVATLGVALCAALLPAPGRFGDPASAVRATLIAAGLLLGIAAPLACTRIRETEDGADFGPWSIALAIWVLGWVCIPVWANGLLPPSERAILDWLSVHRRLPYAWLGRGYAYAVFLGLPLSALFACVFAFNACHALVGKRGWRSALMWMTLPATLALTWRALAICVVWIMD